MWVYCGNCVKIKSIPKKALLTFVFFMTFCMGLYPIVDYSDKDKYLRLYMSIYNNTYWGEYKDFGWFVFVKICTKVFATNYYLFFLLISFIYTLCYYKFSMHFFGRKYSGYFILMAFGCLGFTGYGVNTIRSGIAVGFLLLSLTFEKRIFYRVLFALLSMMFHLSMVLPIGAYLLVKSLKKDKFVYFLWLFCFMLSILNTDLTSIVEVFMTVDERVDKYINMGDEMYKKGYRVDFLIYSLIPIIISYYYKKKRYIKFQLFRELYLTYIVVNAFWLLVIRMAFTNRIAYLSWMIIPFIVLYPIISNQEVIKKPQRVVLRVMTLFIGVNLLLSLRDLLLK